MKTLHIPVVFQASATELPFPDNYFDAVFTDPPYYNYLGLGVDRLADKNSVLCRLIPQTEAIGSAYGRQALPMLWDYIEMNPMEHASGWMTILEELLANIEHCCSFQNPSTTLLQSSVPSQENGGEEDENS